MRIVEDEVKASKRTGALILVAMSSNEFRFKEIDSMRDVLETKALTVIACEYVGCRQ